ncbi:nuclear transport factor 2 family protein [Novosphingobium mangrovi (ex Huang et al. 2023)]|uniref:Nuclear transport factor 2 family protein n=1 Tax=Novosphingobium mangrovi (ex Huang et al. 2023) TaxID=2976432 RepID=A0ABT2I7L5_9SPHN|nr:nuclear transport factor 2 family protein [Novosphingobium mangrovi (ex Huang et al. 2023)]MCT2400816.1 nuclear transport factor 2 family protein [Novosphingobium mangrovi (ex Huang et al. 2023)]
MTGTPAFEDWLAICNLKAAYCRLLDTKDWDNWKQLFTEDCVVDTRPSGGTLEEGRDRFTGMVSRSLADAKTAHQIHSPQITVEGDTAEVVWAMQDRVIKDTFALTGYGHYHETCVRTADGWKIARQTLTRLIVEMDGKPA